MRIFGSDRISGLMLKLGMEEGVPIEHRMVSRSIERAQKQVEAQNFAVRKHLLEYDDVMNKQRKAVYDMRRMILEGKDTRNYVLGLVRDVLDWYLDNYCDEKPTPTHWNLEGLQSALKETFGLEVPARPSSARWAGTRWRRPWRARIRARYEEKERAVGAELMLFHQRMIMLQIVDTQWKDHLYSLDHLKEGIGLRGYGQRDPLVEYKKESFQMFQALMDRIDEEILRWIFLYQPVAVPRETRARREDEDAAVPDAGAPEPGPRRRRAGAGVPRARAGPGGRPGACPATSPSTTRRPARPPSPSGRAPGGPGRKRRGPDRPARGQEGRPQRPLPLRQREEVQEVPEAGVRGASGSRRL